MTKLEPLRATLGLKEGQGKLVRTYKQIKQNKRMKREVKSELEIKHSDMSLNLYMTINLTDNA